MRKRYIILLLLGGILAGTVIGLVVGLMHDLPQIRALENFQPSEVTRIYSADNQVLGELFIEKRDFIPLQQMPAYLKAAIIATEDRGFYSHSGIDLKGIFRAAVHDILAGEFAQGASTITQQLTKTLFLTPRKTLGRKIKEAFLAFQLERRYTKDEILQFYLNQIYLGSGAYGVASAARVYFGKRVQELTLAECALIAGLPKGPSRYSPLINRSLAVQRRNTVLHQMHETGIISADELAAAVKEPIRLKSDPESALKAPYFVEYVRRFLEERLGPSLVYKGGLTVHTTLSLAFQQAAEKAVAQGLAALEKRMQAQKSAGPPPQAALVSLDVSTGGILAMVGGRQFSASPFNRALSAKRQPGSAFKPIVYACAVEQGIPQSKTLLDAPVVFKGGPDGGDWKPNNFSEGFKGEMTLRKALALSQNIPAIKLIEMLGPEAVVQFAHRLGIESHLAPNLSLALGTSGVTLLELTAAYAVFANRGKWIEPFGVQKIYDRRHQLLFEVKPAQKIVMSRTGAAVMSDMLQGVVQEGTGKKALVIKRPLAGKTGTSDHYRDALFIGFSPSVAAGVWVGRDAYETLGKYETGAQAALPIWIDYMQAALAQRPYQYFDLPDDVVRVAIDPDTGRRLAADDPDAVTALFKKGSEPH